LQLENPHGSAKCLDGKAAVMSKPSSDDLGVVSVLMTNDAAELAVAKSLLDAEGIECEIQGESGQETLGAGPFPGASGPMRLMVARTDEEAARGLLEQHR
jgi:hypothetical protein